MMKILNFVIINIIILVLSSAASFAQEEQQLKGDHFIIFFTTDKDFAERVLDKAEHDYDRIAADLGYARYSNFWTWANRVKIYIYPDHACFLNESGQPEWSAGMANYAKKEILTFSGCQNFLISVLPHEIAHLIFRDFVGFKSVIPLWLDEGVAQWEEEFRRNEIKMITKSYLEDDTLLSLEDMMELDIRTVQDTDKLHLRTTNVAGHANFFIIDGKTLVRLYYLQSASLVGFLIEEYGATNFTNFCRKLRDGKNLEAALHSVYPTCLSSISELEQKWVEYLEGL